MCNDKGSTYFPVTFTTLSGGPAVISNPGLPRENPVLSRIHGLTLTRSHTRFTHSLTHSDSSDDLGTGLVRKHKKMKINSNNSNNNNNMYGF
mgnify:FL=1